MSLTSGTKLGPYEIETPLGAGGIGEVCRARDTRLGRTVAIKILPEHLSDNPEAKQRFDREARAISPLSHPNICTLYDVGHHGPSQGSRCCAGAGCLTIQQEPTRLILAECPFRRTECQ